MGVCPAGRRAPGTCSFHGPRGLEMRVFNEQLHGKHGACGNSALRDHMWSLSSWPAQAPGPSQGTQPPTCAGLPPPRSPGHLCPHRPSTLGPGLHCHTSAALGAPGRASAPAPLYLAADSVGRASGSCGGRGDISLVTGDRRSGRAGGWWILTSTTPACVCYWSCRVVYVTVVHVRVSYYM